MWLHEELRNAVVRTGFLCFGETGKWQTVGK